MAGNGIYKHGVYTSEQATSLIVPIEGSAGLQVIFGTAPKASSTPVLAYSFEEAKEALGYDDDWKKYTLCESMKACFDLFNIAPVVFVNVATTDEDTEVTKADIITAIDTKLREIRPRFNMTPGLILAPGWSEDAEVAAKLQSACENIEGVYTCECIVDIDTEKAKTYQDVKTAKETQGLTSVHCIAGWPHIKVGETKYHASSVIGALLAYTDAKNGDIPCLSPSNKLVSGITSLCLADNSEVILTQEQANLVNSFGVVTFLNMNGFRCWGNNTVAYPANTDPKDRWIMVRRFFTWRRNSLILTYFQKVDNPANYQLIESIVDSENINGNSFVARQICAGYQVSFLKAENPITKILDGTITFHIHLSPFTPAEDIEFILEFDPRQIETALGGE